MNGGHKPSSCQIRLQIPYNLFALRRDWLATLVHFFLHSAASFICRRCRDTSAVALLRNIFTFWVNLLPHLIAVILSIHFRVLLISLSMIFSGSKGCFGLVLFCLV